MHKAIFVPLHTRLADSQMNFQHNEIVAKREKQKHMEIAMEKSKNKRQKIKDKVQHDVKNRRERLSKTKFPLTTPLTRQALRDELQSDDGSVHHRFARTFPNLVQKKEDTYKAEIHRMKHQELPALQRIVDQYAEQFGTTADATAEKLWSDTMYPVETSVTLETTQGAVKTDTN